MKKFLSLFVLAAFAAGCASAPTVTSTTANTTDSVNNNLTNAKVETAGNSNKPPVLKFGIDGNAKGSRFPNPNANGGIDVKNVKVVTPTKPAPDNSQVSSTMNKEGTPIETRTFKNHPILLKTERIYADVDNPNSLVYLKNGKIVTLPQDANVNLSNAPANEILRAISITADAAPQKNASTKKED